MPTLRALALLLLPVAALAGCGSQDDAAALPPPAGPAPSPPAVAEPDGRPVAVGGPPTALVADPRSGLVAVSVGDPARLVFLDARRARVVGDVPLPRPARHLALAPPLLAPPSPAGADPARVPGLAVVDLPRGPGRVIVPAAPGVHEIAVADGRVLATDLAAPALRTVGAALPLPPDPHGLAALPEGRVAVVLARKRTLALVDPRTLRVLAEEPAGVGPTHVVAAGRWLFVADTAADALLVFRAGPDLELVRRIAMPGSPYAMAVDARRGEVWVAMTSTNRVLVLSAEERPQRRADFDAPRGPVAIAVDERTGRAFVAGREDGVVRVLDRQAR